MNRGRVVGVIALAVAAALVVWLAVRRRQASERMVPAWLQVYQPPDSVAPDMLTLTEAESWAANRCLPMVAPCGNNTARRRTRRVYPGSLAESPHSFIRASIAFGGGV